VRLAALLLVACAESAPGEPVRVLPDLSTVYDCLTSFGVEEYCFDGDERELSRMVGARCVPSEHERFRVGPLGELHPVCVFCCGPDCGPGCNSLNGCACE